MWWWQKFISVQMGMKLDGIEARFSKFFATWVTKWFTISGTSWSGQNNSEGCASRKQPVKHVELRYRMQLD